MYLKSSVSNARKLFTRTIQSVKSLFVVATYQRLSNTPPPPPPPTLFSFCCIGRHGVGKSLSQSYRELDKFYTDFTSQEDGNIIDINPIRSKTNTLSTTLTQGLECGGRVINENYDQVLKKKTRNDQKKMKNERSVCQEKISNTFKGEVIREERRCLVAKKLKELEAIDVENVLDIEEVVYYYSLLTSPVYIEIFDKFFISICADLFNFKAVAHCNTISCPTFEP